MRSIRQRNVLTMAQVEREHYKEPEPDGLPALWRDKYGFSPSGVRGFHLRHGERAAFMKDLFPGDALAEYPGTVWCVGGGSSLRGFDWSQLAGEIVIAANRSFEMPNVTVACTIDMRFYNWIHDGTLGEQVTGNWLDFRGPKCIATIGRKTFHQCEALGIYDIPRNPKGWHFPPDFGTFGKATNSGYMAVCIALAMGARRVGLLGFDLHGDGKKQCWHHTPHPSNCIQAEDTYSRFQGDFRELADWLETQPQITITNFGETSKLGVFPRVPLAEVAQHLTPQRKPVIITMYTEGTPYEQEYKPLQHAAVAMGYNFKAYPYQSTGNWHQNTCMKPRIILQALDEFAGQPVVFMDADARIRRYPSLLNSFAADFGCVRFDWDAIGQPGAGSRRGLETSSAVLYCGPHPGTRRILRDWQAQCDIAAAANLPRGQAGDQRYLQAAIDAEIASVSDCARVEYLPMSYNQIFDHMAHLGAPVIEQMQASRRLSRSV